MNPRNIAVLPPVKHTGLRLSERQHRAAGIPAVLQSLAHIHEETDVLDGIRILNRMNQ